MLTFLIVDMTAGEVCQASGNPTVIDQRFSGRLDLMLHDGGDRSDGGSTEGTVYAVSRGEVLMRR